MNQAENASVSWTMETHQRRAEHQKRVAMRNYLQDHDSELSEPWINACEDAWTIWSPLSLMYVHLYGC